VINLKIAGLRYSPYPLIKFVVYVLALSGSK